MLRTVGLLTAIVAWGCTTADDQTNGEGTSFPDETPTTGSTTSASSAPCATVAAGRGWTSDFVPQQYTDNAQFGFFATPNEPSSRPIDGVIGLSNGPASHFADLGAIVRFNPNGYVDARDGSAYHADFAIPYTVGHQYLIQMKLNFVTHLYTAQIAEYPNGQLVTFATQYHFRTEQATMPRADNFARIVDSPTGSLDLCYWGGGLNAHVSRAGDPWSVTPMRSESGSIHVEFEVGQLSPYQSVDAVYGLSAASPHGFSDLAAIARLSPAGIIDARDGSSYRADAKVAYVGNDYVFQFDVNVPSHTYSLTVVDEATGVATVVAHNYAFRTEQRNATSLGYLGQYVDSSAGTVYSQRLLERY